MIALFLAELRRSWIQFIRYPLEAILGVFISTITFYFLFMGASYIAGPGVNLSDSAGAERLDVLVIGYVLWILTLFVLTETTNSLEAEAKTGTLEQLFLSPFRAVTVFLLRALAGLAIRLILIAVSLGLILGITGSRLSFPPLLLLPLVTMLMSTYGFAFLLGGLLLLFKQVRQLLGGLQFGLLLLIGTPVENLAGLGRLVALMAPMTPSAGLLRDLMARSVGLDWAMFGIALANGVIYLGLGLWCFSWAERLAKQRGLLSGY
ncbi:MAG: ABC transporter permease [Synechococcales cyanobacterium RM1_1_8]|nr:ABC transporter permease [Synechococcales cyanobacterium RM1_1_8]